MKLKDNKKRYGRFIQKLKEYKELSEEDFKNVDLKGLSNTDKMAYNYILTEKLRKQE